MGLRRFSIEDLDYFTYECVVEKNSQGSGRWSEHFEVIFTADDETTYYRVTIKQGLTEYQDGYYGSERYPDSEPVVGDPSEYYVMAVQVQPQIEMVPTTVWVGMHDD